MAQRPETPASPMERLRGLATQARKVWLAILGAPDYRAYLEHHRVHHPEEPPLSESEYSRCFIDHKYGKRGGGSRCC